MTIISSGHSGETWWGWRVTVESCCYLDSSPGSLSHFRRWVGKLLNVRLMVLGEVPLLVRPLLSSWLGWIVSVSHE